VTKPRNRSGRKGKARGEEITTIRVRTLKALGTDGEQTEEWMNQALAEWKGRGKRKRQRNYARNPCREHCIKLFVRK